MDDRSDEPPAGLTPLARLCEEVIALRERTDRQHRTFEQLLAQTRDDMSAGLRQFVAEAQAAYQYLRDELTGEKRFSLSVLAALIDRACDLNRLAKSCPALDGQSPELIRWADAVSAAARQADTDLARLGVFRFDAAFGEPYQPALHERIGSKQTAGLDPLRIAEQIDPGYACRKPDVVLRRAKVLLSE